ncbi:ATP-binding protein [Candidatus Latescibacterota bacterium]
MIPRSLEKFLLRDAEYYPVLTLTGPRQSGKTTLARAAFPDHQYVSLEETESRLFARDDPRGFLRQHSGPVIVDEAQRVPELFSYIQRAVDDDDRAGRFVLTGSANFLLMEQVSQTLAGRSGVLHLLPFSRAELEQGQQDEPDTPATLFGNRSTDLELWGTLHTGFYPRIHDRRIPASVWLPDYVQTYLQRDVRSLVSVGDLERFERFLMLVAGRVGQLLNYSSLANDCGIAVDTARRWLSVLKTSFVALLLNPHHRNFNKRLIKSPKLYLYDTGLACHLLGIREPEQLMTHPLRGPLFENLIVAEVAKTYLHHRRQPPIHFWRDQQGHEIDLLIEEGEDLYPVEIKSGETVSQSMLDGLVWWCKQANRPATTATLVYGGQEHTERHGVAVRPWFSV